MNRRGFLRMIGVGAVAAPVVVHAAVTEKPPVYTVVAREPEDHYSSLAPAPAVCQGPIQGWPEFMHGQKLPIRTAQNLSQEQVAYILERRFMTQRRARWDRTLQTDDDTFDIEAAQKILLTP
jgi:hypothetical protein